MKGIRDEEMCLRLHTKLDRALRLRFPIRWESVPLDGIYFVFEIGEMSHGHDRIVRVGTHTGGHKLHSRLREHLYVENKDRSIFRKNIGRALLSRTGDPFLAQWNWGLLARADRERFGSRVDKEKLAAVEEEVTAYMRDSLSFVVLPESSREWRLTLEAKTIGLISSCQLCGPSQQWLGLHSPKPKIRESGLWQEQHLYREPLNAMEMERLLKATR